MNRAPQISLRRSRPAPRVEVLIPDDYRPEATAAPTGVLSPIVKQQLDIVGRCKN